MVTTLTSKGQVTVPKAIRERLELTAGAKLEFRLQDDGTIQVVPLRSSLKQLKYLLPKPDVSLTLEEMDDAIYQAIRERAFGNDRD
jgi:AbrB family looped-hinge helix DNA binding protein